MNGDNSRLEIRSTWNNDWRKRFECIRRMDRYYWKKDDVILSSSREGESIFRRVKGKQCCYKNKEKGSIAKKQLEAKNGRKTQDRGDETGDEEEDRREEGYNCK